LKGLVVIPTYNESENVRSIIPKVLTSSDMVDVLIVDDNSPDGTGMLVEEMSKVEPRVAVLHRKGKLGLGSAYIAGFRYALEKGYDFVFEMDADHSHDPAEIPNFIEALGEADIVIGSRYIDGVRILNWPMKRLILSYGASLYTRMITGLDLLDCTGGYKCFRREVLEKLNLDRVHSDGYCFQIELNFLCYKKGFRLKEIPIVFAERMHGHSKLDRGIVYEALAIVWLLRIKSILGIL